MSSSDSPSAAVERALAMLEVVAQEPDGPEAAPKISRKLKIPKSSASYILRTLDPHYLTARNEESREILVALEDLSLSASAQRTRCARRGLADHAPSKPGRPA